MRREDRERRKRTFNEAAEKYQRTRPPYPDEVFGRLFELAPIGPDSRVLEIGAASGRASVSIAASGCELICLEPGPDLAALAANNLRPFPKAKVEVAEFESYEPAGAFDAIVAASSWHWIDPETRYAKAARALVPGGSLCLITSEHAYPEDFDPFFAEVQRCYEGIGWKLETFPPPIPDLPDEYPEFEASRFFGAPAVSKIVWSREFQSQEYIDLLDTYSDHRLLEPPAKTWLFECIRRLIATRPGRRVIKHFLTFVVVARRSG
ncbi:MAG TPA: class I SAM-dependent methyltransferase [Fimbriimonadaceae bacterium]|nr:class I SAM-dependent methyltransferase [Fimbriimonadaceae bacterium]